MHVFLRAVGIIISAALLLTLTPAVAQDDSTLESERDNPDQGYIVRWSQEVIFPQAVRFTIGLGIPLAEVAQINLTLRAAGQADTVIVLDLAQTVLVEEPFADFAYAWNFPPEAAPPLFEEVELEWRVTSLNGETARVQDVFVFRDWRIEWQSGADPQGFINIILPADSITTPGQIRRDLLPAYNVLSDNVGRSDRFSFIIYPDTLPPGCTLNAEGLAVVVGPLSNTEVPCDLPKAAQIFRSQDYDLIQLSATGSTVQAAMMEYFVQTAYAALWQGKSVPSWFSVGLAQFYLPGPKSRLLAPLLTAERNNRVYDLSQLAAPPSDAAALTLWRNQSFGLVLYMADRIGLSGLYSLASNIGIAASFENAFEIAMGTPLERLIPDWRTWLFTRGAEVAFNFIPYQGATATPSPTITPTPTATATASDTPTLTATPTVTGVLSATPFPTRIPPRTPTRSPATVTPRPAGSLNTPVPTAIPSVSVNLTEPGVNIGLIVLLAVSLLLIIVGLFRMRR